MSSDADSTETRKWETPIVFHDEPLRDEDKSFFRFDEYATTLARLIARKETRTPMVLCIDGPWGSGKTTLLRRLAKQLGTAADGNAAGKVAFLDQTEREKGFYKDDWRRIRTVWFDAWKYAGEDQVLAALLRVILATMREDAGFWKKIRSKFTGVEAQVDWLGGLLYGASKLAGGVVGDLDLRDFRKTTPLADATAFYDFFSDSLNRLFSYWVEGRLKATREIDEKKGAMVVFIDDLDRCLPAKTVQVLEAIKLFINQPGCVFVLAADTDIVERAVESHYANSGIMNEAAGDYLDKIIQLRFPLPAIVDAQMQTFLGDAQFAEIVGEGMREDWRVLIAGADNNPRKVKGIVNDLNLQWAMLVNAGQADGVERIDFLRLQMLLRAAPGDLRTDLRRMGSERRVDFLQTLLLVAEGKGSDADRQSMKKYRGDWRSQQVQETLARNEFAKDINKALIGTCLSMRSEESSEPLPGSDVSSTFEESGVSSAAGMTADSSAMTRDEALEGRIRGLRKILPSGRVVDSSGALNSELEEQPDHRIVGGIEFLKVPAGDFIMGSEESNKLAGDNESPQHRVKCLNRDYWLARHPVTNRQYNEYLKAKTPPEEHCQEDEKLLDHPVVNVSWRQAMAYCKWLNDGAASDGVDPERMRISLPSEAEWEKAARGTQGLEWPWGNEFDSNRCNSAENGTRRTTPVGRYSPGGDGVFGHADLSGNVWEWTRSSYRDYEYESEPDRLVNPDLAKADRYVLRGGAFGLTSEFVRCAFRLWSFPGFRSWLIGFRVVLSPFL